MKTTKEKALFLAAVWGGGLVILFVFDAIFGSMMDTSFLHWTLVVLLTVGCVVRYLTWTHSKYLETLVGLMVLVTIAGFAVWYGLTAAPLVWFGGIVWAIAASSIAADLLVQFDKKISAVRTSVWSLPTGECFRELYGNRGMDVVTELVAFVYLLFVAKGNWTAFFLGAISKFALLGVAMLLHSELVTPKPKQPPKPPAPDPHAAHAAQAQSIVVPPGRLDAPAADANHDNLHVTVGTKPAVTVTAPSTAPVHVEHTTPEND